MTPLGHGASRPDMLDVSESPEPGGVSWKIGCEVVVVLGWGRAILMQFAHPLVAAGVADHSTFDRSPFSYMFRLRRTIRAALDLTFGGQAEAGAAASRINRIHDHVTGVLREPVGVFPAGTRYSAHDPGLLSWVHATLVDSMPLAYELFVGPLTTEEKERYVAEAATIAPLLGIPDGWLPVTREALDAYLTTMYGSGEISVGDTARRLADQLLHPPFQTAIWPLAHLIRLTTIGLLPPALRNAYGLRWDVRDSRRLDRAARLVRTLRWISPRLLREWPSARRARRV